MKMPVLSKSESSGERGTAPQDGLLPQRGDRGAAKGSSLALGHGAQRKQNKNKTRGKLASKKTHTHTDHTSKVA